LARLEARENGVRQAHPGKSAGCRKQSGPECAPNDGVDSRNERQEEADRDAGEAGQDEEGRLCNEIGRAAADGDGAIAGVPEKSEGGDCRDDPNERSP